MMDNKSILDALVGAVANSGGSSAQGGGLGDLLGAALGGQQQQGGGLGDLLGAALGGQQQHQQQQYQQQQYQQQQGGGLGDLLGSALSGGSSAGGGLGGLLGSVLSSAAGGAGSAAGGLGSAAGGLGGMLGSALGGAVSGGGAASGSLVDMVKSAVAKNPALVAGAAGLLLGTSGGRALAGSAAKLGGLALVGALAYKSLKSFQSEGGKTGVAALGSADSYVPASAKTEEGPLILARAMIAAAMADGKLDAQERAQIAGNLAKTGGDEAQQWLRNELQHPATPEALAKGVKDVAQATEIYAAARVAIEPDTDAEIDFLNRLSDALHLDPQLITEIDNSVSDLKEPV
ncbi:MAG: DUF533 domain-containing protein [Methylobacteriaceae bacterium]|jgi:uncharacterized membrane protein YebE (DUF533 family)|nr:DUF533 domain-containing protein [Methylobacteriaceae bacterium]